MEINYHETLDQLGAAVTKKLAISRPRVFLTNVRKKLFNLYLTAIGDVVHKLGGNSEEVVQQYRCNHCSRFMKRVGSAVTIDDEGKLTSVYWDPTVVTDPVMKAVVGVMKDMVEQSRVDTLYNPSGSYANYEEWTDNGGKEFRHFYVKASLLTPVWKNNNEPVVENHREICRIESQVAALTRFIKGIKPIDVMKVESWFSTKQIKPVGDSEETVQLVARLLGVVKALIHFSPEYEAETVDYRKETMITNLVWRWALSDSRLLTAKNSILGALLLNMAEGGSDQSHMKFWATKTDGLHYRRTTREASGVQLENTQQWLMDNGYDRSLKQIEAAESEFPVIWVAKAAYSKNTAVEEAPSQDFGQFVKGKGEPKKEVEINTDVDLGFFVNNVLPHVEELAFAIPAESAFKPIHFNKMLDLDAPPIFKWDTAEKRLPFIGFYYSEPTDTRDLLKSPSMIVNGEAIIPVLSVTSAERIGMISREELSVTFLMGDVKSPVKPRPALFSEALIGDFYPHRRALEDYSRVTNIPRTEGQQAIGFTVGPWSWQAESQGRVKKTMIKLLVKLNKTGAALFGSDKGVFRFSSGGWTDKPELDKFPIITDRNKVQEVEVIQEQEAPVMSFEPN